MSKRGIQILVSTYTASKPLHLHCESCTYNWQSQAVDLDKHVLLHLDASWSLFGVVSAEQQGKHAATSMCPKHHCNKRFLQSYWCLHIPRMFRAVRPTNQWTNTTSHEKCARVHPIADTLVKEHGESHSVSTSGREVGSAP